MSRVAKKVTIEFLKQRVLDAITYTDDRHDGEGEDPTLLRELVAKDLKVKFDWENWDWHHYSGNTDPLLGCCTIGNGFTFLGMSAGGDWEYPVWFCVYWDGKRLRAYIPTAGNPWNLTTKRAYGNSDEADLKDYKKRIGDPAFKLPEGEDICEWVDRDYGKILADLMERIEVKL